MPIRFACPACQQPIEVDEQWGGQSVACPYCQRVVSAPTSSTLPARQVPTASPATGYEPTPPPATGSQPVHAPRPGGRGLLALGLAMVSLVLGVAGWLVGVGGPLEARVIDRFGVNPSPEQIQQVVDETRAEWAKGNIQLDRRGVLASTIGLICSAAALILAIQSLLRHERRRVSAIIACILGSLMLACEAPVMGLGCMGPRPLPAHTVTAPAAPAPGK
jgi:hypothetical protein